MFAIEETTIEIKSLGKSKHHAVHP